MTGIVLNLQPFIEFSNEQFYELCQNHRDLQFERTARGELIIMLPVGGESGNREASVISNLFIWNMRSRLGKVLSSSAGFILPNGANRSPDAS